MQDELLPPDLSDTPTNDLCALMLVCGMSNDPSDKMFVKACRDELAKRKTYKLTQPHNPQNQPLALVEYRHIATLMIATKDAR